MDSKPVQLTNGYYIAPQTPATENFTAITGLPPTYVAVQGEQVFDVYQTVLRPGGSFRGYVTTTADFLGFYSEAILVDEILTGTEGTAAGQVPPVGSVYNVIYFNNDNSYNLYSSLPSPSGNVISDKLVTPLGVLPVYTTFNAAAPPPIHSLTVPGQTVSSPLPPDSPPE